MILLKLLIMLKPFITELILGNKQKKRDSSIKIMVAMVVIMFVFISYMNAASTKIQEELIKNRTLAGQLTAQMNDLQKQAQQCAKDQSEYKERLDESKKTIESSRDTIDELKKIINDMKPGFLPPTLPKDDLQEKSVLLYKLKRIEE